MNAVLFEKQQQLLARAEKAPLELPPPLPQPNARDFSTNRKRKMTGLEAALQEERDAIVRRRREIRQAEEDEDFRQRYHEEAIARILARYSQQQSSAPESLSSPPILSAPPSPTQPPPLCDSDSGHKDAAETAEALRPRRGVRRTQKLVDNSQAAKELAASKGWKGKGPIRRKPGKKAAAAAAEMSQLLDGYLLLQVYKVERSCGSTSSIRVGHMNNLNCD
ncbi:MAG: hypothetical protein M1839_003606 [Geoglossum umbratile]|nr:MAG: hypothetical protein M1839_003606 [Geoglossum umbratile]